MTTKTTTYLRIDVRNLQSWKHPGGSAVKVASAQVVILHPTHSLSVLNKYIQSLNKKEEEEKKKRFLKREIFKAYMKKAVKFLFQDIKENVRKQVQRALTLHSSDMHKFQ